MIEFVALMSLCGFFLLLCFWDNKLVRVLILKIFFAFLIVVIIWANFFENLLGLIAN